MIATPSALDIANAQASAPSRHSPSSGQQRGIAAHAFQPRDRTKREHVAQLDRVRWVSDDDTRVILSLTDGGSAVGPGARETFGLGQRYRFHGRWKDGKFGPEFHFDTVTLDDPHTRAGTVKYLSDICRGVGIKTAEALWTTYGPDAVRKLREEPAEVVADAIMREEPAKEASEGLTRYVRFERTRVDLFGLFAGRGFPGRLIDRAIATFGVAAPAIIKRNPFTLLIRKLPGAGFKRCDKLYLDLGGRKDGRKRQAVCGWNALREDRTGSTWATAEDAIAKILAEIPNADPVRALTVLRRAGWARIRRDGTKRFVAIRERADAEQRVADSIRRLLRSPSQWPTDILVSSVEGDGLPSAHQVAELKRATARSVGCFVGGPGTGKTHSLAFLLRQILADTGPASTAVAAPTGKASVRAGESLRGLGLDLRATTIHQLLEIGRNGHDGDGWGFQRNTTNPLGQTFLIIDETSMVDVGLLADTLEACADGTQVLLIGDSHQLPPVGHGAPLRDLLASGIVPFGELTEVRRNSGTIVRACASIKAGTPVEFPRKLDLDAVDPANLRIIDCTQNQVPATVEDVLSTITRFDRIWETQIITGLNEKGDCSRKSLNDRLGKLLNPDGIAAKSNPFKVGDKIICRRNTRLKCVVPIARAIGPAMAADASNYQPADFEFAGSRFPEWYVANGELGRVVAVSEKHSIVRFGTVDTPLVIIASGKRPTGDTHEESEDGGGKSADFEPAWAITVHGSQGSEWPCVLCIVDDAAAQIADRNYWYTAISRARKACVLIGPLGVFQKQVKRQAIDRRRTFLPELLRTQSEIAPLPTN